MAPSVSETVPTMNGSTSPSPRAAPTEKDKKQPLARSSSKDNDKSRDKDRETRLPACEACRTRKVKCDALLPACTPCQKSGRECFGRDKIPNVSRGLVYELQQKVKDLESRLALASSGSNGQPSTASNGQSVYDSDNASASGSRASRPEGSSKRQRRGRHGYQSLHHDKEGAESEDDCSDSDAASSSPGPADLSPNDFIQQTSTILESLSSDLTGSAHRQHHLTPSRSSTQRLDNDEATALAALSRHHRDRARSPHRLKRRSSSNASRYRDDASSYYVGLSRLKDAPASIPFKSRSRPGRFGMISAYDRTFFDRLIARYLTYMNSSLPVINEGRMWEQAALVYQDDERARLQALAASSYDAMPPPPLPPSPAVDRLTLSKYRYTVLMALAIALASLGRSHNFSPELRRLGHQYWSEAQAMYPVLYRYGDIDKLRATLLQLQYAFLVPTAGSVWELSGAAVRLVTELNLHVDREYDSAANAAFSQETIDLRRRLFWTTYCLDRSLAMALARPPGLSDAWIHVQLPSLLADADLIRADREGGSSTHAHESSRIDPQKQVFRAHVNLRRIQSEILCRLHSVNPRDYSLDNDGVSLSQSAASKPSLALVMEVGPPTPNVEWQTRMMEKLVEWRSESDRIRLPSPAAAPLQGGNESVSSSATPFITRDWIDLSHNLTVSLLFRPSPNNPRPDSHGLQQAFMASGRAMKIYKSMHRSATINFPWLATHHLFISGLTHLNALEKLTRTGVQAPSPIVEVVFNVQSCASTLEALTSRDDGYGTRIRDTFDAAASAVLRSVLDPNAASSSSSGNGSSAADLASVEEFIRTTTHSHSQQQGERRSTPLRGTPHESLYAASSHPTWLSDSTWSSMSALDAAPPPGSTIFVAAPPRTTRFGTPGSSLVPTISERTTQSPQNTGKISHATLPGTQGTPAQRGFGVGHQYASMAPNGLSFGTGAGSSEGAFGLSTGGADTNTSQRGEGSTNGGPSVAGGEEAEKTAAAFGFHNWLLQPYEGGADGLGQLSMVGTPFGSAQGGGGGGILFGSGASPSAYMAGGAGGGLDPFSSLCGAVAGAGSGYVGQSPGKLSATQGAGGGGGGQGGGQGQGGVASDASTLLDFLSMLPGQSANVSGGKVANGSPQSKA